MVSDETAEDRARVRSEVADLLGLTGVYVDPLWRIEVRLTALERRLLRSRWVRRLAFVSHAGASSIATTQTYSRLEHSLGVLALVAHFAPDDHAARATALLHDVGHLPFSHTFEGLAGLDHHRLGAARIRDLAPLLREFGVDCEELIAIDRGERPSVLHNSSGALRLDHLDSFLRSGRSHGRTTEPPSKTLRHVRIVRGCIDTDAATGSSLRGLIEGEARAHLSEINIVTNAVLRHLAAVVLSDEEDERIAHLARLADDQFWAVLLHDPRTADLAQALRDDPTQWEAHRHKATVSGPGTALTHTVRRLYLDLPLIEGEMGVLPALALPVTPIRFDVTERARGAEG